MSTPANPRPFGPDHVPFEDLGHEATVRLAHRFYDHMDEHEPALVAVHRLDESASRPRVAPIVRERFAAFLVEWLGGPSDYSKANGHPRLRMRHGHVPVDVSLRDAWLRSMNAALAHAEVPEHVRSYLERRFAEVADFLRNQP